MSRSRSGDSDHSSACSKKKGVCDPSVDVAALRKEFSELSAQRVEGNEFIENELKSKSEIPIEQLRKLKSQLLYGIEPCIKIYELIRANSSGDEMSDLRITLDRIERDQQQLCRMIQNRIDDKEVVLNFGEKKSRSLSSKHSSSKYSTTKTNSRESLRSAEANAAAAKITLKASIEQAKLEDSITQIEIEEAQRKAEMEAKIKRMRRQAEQQKQMAVIEAEEAKVAILSQDMDGGSVLLARSQPRSGNERALSIISQPIKTFNSNPSRPAVIHVMNNESSFEKTLVDCLRMPIAEPPVFNGNPLKFRAWLTKFDSLIGNKSCNNVEKLQLMEGYVSGPAHEAISGFFMLNTDEAYKKARATLEKRFGGNHLIAEAFMERLDNWPKVASKDNTALRKLSDFVQQCLTAMTINEDLEILNTQRESRKIVSKLPDWLINAWSKVVSDSDEQTGKYPAFSEFATFLERHANRVTNPLNSFKPTDKTISQDTAKKATSYFMNGSTTAPQNKTSACTFCNRTNHSTERCYKYLALSVQERQLLVQKNKLCYNCLKKGHFSNICVSKSNCETCSMKHHTTLHREKSSSPENENQVNISKAKLPEDIPMSENAVCRRSTIDDDALTSMALPVWISNGDKKVLTYALLDSQSDTSFISEALSMKLCAKAVPAKLNLTTMGEQNMKITCDKVIGLKVHNYDCTNVIELPPIYTRKTIPAVMGHIPTRKTAKSWPHLKKISEEIPNLLDVEVGMLLGYNCPQAMIPRQCVIGGNHEPYAIKTDLGWCVIGRHKVDDDKENVFSARMIARPVEAPHDEYHQSVSFKVRAPLVSKPHNEIKPTDVIDALQLDFAADKDLDYNTDSLSVEDQRFMDILTNGVYQDKEGFVTMPLPLRQIPDRGLAGSRAVAEHRLKLLMKKFERDCEYERKYRDFMSNIIQHGDVEPSTNDEGWYIPHFGVFHPKKPEKIRVVFDCSAKSDGMALNDYLLQGPAHINSLLGILLRFRKERVALSCDIERMFHQFRVEPVDRKYLKFLWPEDGKLSIWQMKVHLFGATSSPGCATFGLRTLAQKFTECKEEMDEAAKHFILNDFYVDDGLTSVPDSKTATALATATVELCKKGNIRLHKFVSNSQEFLKSIPESERGTTPTHNIEFQQSLIPSERALGVEWDTITDSFRFKVSQKTTKLTRRRILATVASIYDPLGLIAPTVLIGKQILQEMCKDNLGWDDEPPREIAAKWEAWKMGLDGLGKIAIPRCYKPDHLGNVKKVEIHNFSDASSQGYGQCSYLRLVDEDDRVHCTLIMGKSRVAPIKVVTIPRLELQAASTSAVVSKLLRQQLGYPEMEEYFWTDSQVILGYILNEARRFHIYVANRIQKIHNLTKPTQWRYIPTHTNPADHASRGLPPDKLETTNWFTGPKFLWSEPMEYPDQPQFSLSECDPEVKVTSLHTSCVESPRNLIEMLERCSTWETVVRIVSTLENIARKIKRADQLTQVQSLLAAERTIIKQMQELKYEYEIKLLQHEQSVPNSSTLAKLDPFLDQEGILRIGGRLQQSNMQYEEVHPIIIPNKMHLTTLLIRFYHQKIGHQGKGMTVAKIRSAGLWIIGGNRATASLISNCVICRRKRGTTHNQQMASLPPERLEIGPPFSYVGGDCFGPFVVKEGRREIKRYGLMLTCMSSRAVHIEVLDDLSTDAFINGLRAFIAIRGPIKQLRTDKGTNFVGADTELRKELDSMDANKVKQFLCEKRIDFVTNTAGASHMGGVWERCIRTARSVLVQLLKSHGGRVDTTTLRTLMYEVMSVVNGRPLTTENLNDKDLTVITPNTLLTMKTDVVLPPPGKFVEVDVYARKRWKQVQFLANLFWQRWRNEYLSSLQARQKWYKQKPNVMVGDVVIVNASDVVRNEWRLGRVTECMKSSDSLVRSVKIKLGTMGNQESIILERPVHKIVVLVRAGGSD